MAPNSSGVLLPLDRPHICYFFSTNVNFGLNFSPHESAQIVAKSPKISKNFSKILDPGARCHRAARPRRPGQVAQRGGQVPLWTQVDRQRGEHLSMMMRMVLVSR